MENLKKSLSKNRILIITLSICVFFTLCIFFISLKEDTTNSSNNYTNGIVKDFILKEYEPYINELSEINTSMKKCINGVTINSKSASIILNDNLNKLKNLKQKVSSVVVANNNTPEMIPKIILCIENTEYLYSYCVDVLSYTSNL